MAAVAAAWQEIVKRDRQGQVSNTGEVWGAPYRWGTTVIAYRRDKFRELGWTPKDWSDLWRPELRDRISVVDQPREVIGLTLKKLGRSYNTTNLSQVQTLKKNCWRCINKLSFIALTTIYNL
jgi:putative spermidine/putrescine transport system substrate-binding protein